MLLTNFSMGELSPYLRGRVDLQQYYQGAARIDNFRVIPTGGLTRRTGLKRMGQLSGNCKLIPFILSPSVNFILEFTVNAIYVWKNGQKYIQQGGQQVSFITAYSSLAEIGEIHWAQNYDTMIFVHKNHKPAMLKYKEADGSFTFAEMAFNFKPAINLDDDYDYVIRADDASSLPAVTVIDGIPYVDGKAYRQGLWCIYSGGLYEYSITDAEWKLQEDDIETDDSLFTSEGKYPGAVTFFNNRLAFACSYTDRQKVWLSCAPDTKGNRYTDFSTYRKEITVDRVIKNPDLHVFSASMTENSNVLTNLTQDFTEEGALEEDISQYYVSHDSIPIGTKAVSCTANTLTMSGNAAATKTGQAMSIQLWKDKEIASSDDYEIKVLNTDIVTSDCAFFFEIASNENDAIKFLSNNKDMVIGTESSVWVMSAQSNALSMYVESSGRYGSDGLMPLCVDRATVFFAQGRRAIREFYYNAAMTAFQTNNIAVHAEQMLEESPAVDLDYEVNPFNRLHVVRSDGAVAILLYDKNNGVMAWTRLTHGTGKVVSCCVTGGEMQNDYVYYAVKDGNGYYLERLDDNDGVYLDSWQVLPHNRVAETIAGYSGAVVLYNSTQNRVIADISGEADIPDDFIVENDVIFVGYSYKSEIESLPVIANNLAGNKRITALELRFYDSYMPVVRCEDVSDEHFYGTEEPFSGVKQITYAGKTERDVSFTIRFEKPYPCVILCVNAICV